MGIGCSLVEDRRTPAMLLADGNRAREHNWQLYLLGILRLTSVLLLSILWLAILWLATIVILRVGHCEVLQK